MRLGMDSWSVDSSLFSEAFTKKRRIIQVGIKQFPNEDTRLTNWIPP